MRFWKKREKDGESAMWRYAKYAVVAVCVIGIGANSISVIPTGYAYEEYDGNWMMCDEAEEMEAYKKDIKKNEKTLPVSMPINSYMWTGDKFSTWYSGVYEIAIEDDMTKEYAKELAKKFAR